jgi:hypothetical protein
MLVSMRRPKASAAASCYWARPIDLGGRAVGATVSTGGTDAQRSVQTCRPAGSWATLPNALTPLSHRQSGKILSSKRRCPASEAALTSLGFNRSELP